MYQSRLHHMHKSILWPRYIEPPYCGRSLMICSPGAAHIAPVLHPSISPISQSCHILLLPHFTLIFPRKGYHQEKIISERGTAMPDCIQEEQPMISILPAGDNCPVCKLINGSSLFP